MTTRETFTDEEWSILCEAAYAAPMAVSAAEPGYGPKVKEAVTLYYFQEFLPQESLYRNNQLIQLVMKDVVGQHYNYKQKISDRYYHHINGALETVVQLADLLDNEEKIVPAEATVFKEFLLELSEKVAEAAYEGVEDTPERNHVTERESEMLWHLRTLLKLTDNL